MDMYMSYDEMQKVEKYITDQKTQAKAAVLLLELHKAKENDHEAMAVCLMLVGTIRKLLEGAEQ